jgi:hypothetical protein
VGIPGILVEEQSARFIVRDHNGQALADVYFEDDPGRRSAEKLLTILRTLLGLDPLMRSLSSPLLRHRLTVLTTQAVEDVNLGHLFQVKIAY